MKVSDIHTCLFHGITFTQGDCVILQCLVVDGDTEGCADGILATVTFADSVLFFIVCGEVELQVVDDFAGLSAVRLFFTRGSTAHFTGARGAGRWSTTRLSPPSRACSS